MRVIYVDMHELGAWLLKSHLSGDLLDGQIRDNVEFWRMEDFDRETKAMNAVRKVFLKEVHDNKLAKARLTKKKHQQLRMKMATKRLQVKRPSPKLKLFKSDTKGMPTLETLVEEAPDINIPNDKEKQIGKAQGGENTLNKETSFVSDGGVVDQSQVFGDVLFATADTVLLENTFGESNASTKNTVPQTVSPIDGDELDSTRQSLSSSKPQARSTPSRGFSSRKRSLSESFDVMPKKMSYHRLEEKYNEVKHKNVLLKTRLDEERGVSKTWEGAYINVVKEVRNDVFDIVSENKKIESSATRLEDAAATLKEASENWKKTELEIKAFIQEVQNNPTGDKTYAWLVPGDPSIPCNFDFGSNMELRLGVAAPDNEVTVETEGPAGDAIKSGKTGPEDKRCWSKFDYENDPSYDLPGFLAFRNICRLRTKTKRMDGLKKRLFAFWYWLGLTEKELFGPDGLESKGALPNPPPESRLKSSRNNRGRDRGNTQIEDEIVEDSKLAEVDYRAYVLPHTELEVMKTVEKQKPKDDEQYTDKQRLLLGCAQIAQLLVKAKTIPYMDSKKKFKKSVARAIFLVNNRLGGYLSKMWECRKIPWIFAILECMTTRYPIPVTTTNLIEQNELPLELLTHLRNMCYRGKYWESKKDDTDLASSSSEE